MYIIRVYINHKLTKTIESNVKSLMMEMYRRLTRIAEQYTFDFGYDTKVEIHENDKLINCIETEF